MGYIYTNVLKSGHFWGMLHGNYDNETKYFSQYTHVLNDLVIHIFEFNGIKWRIIKYEWII